MHSQETASLSGSYQERMQGVMLVNGLVAPEDTEKVSSRQDMKAIHALLWSVDFILNRLGEAWVTERTLQESDTNLIFERSIYTV